MNEKHKCPVCGKYVFQTANSWEECPKCGWIDDIAGSIWENVDCMSANEASLEKCRQVYKAFGTLKVPDERVHELQKEGKVSSYDGAHRAKWMKIYGEPGYAKKKEAELLKQYDEENN